VEEMSEEMSEDMHLFMALWLCKREEEIKGMVLGELRRTYLGLADDDEECKELHSGAQFCTSKASKLSSSKASKLALLVQKCKLSTRVQGASLWCSVYLFCWYKSANTDAQSSTQRSHCSPTVKWRHLRYKSTNADACDAASTKAQMLRHTTLLVTLRHTTLVPQYLCFCASVVCLSIVVC